MQLSDLNLIESISEYQIYNYISQSNYQALGNIFNLGFPLLHKRLGNTYLKKAIDDENVDMVRFLLEHGANPNEGTLYGYPLHIAIKYDNIDIVRLLLEYKAVISEEALLKVQSYPVLRLLLDFGADINDENSRILLFNILLQAKESHLHEMVKYLVEVKNVNFNYEYDDNDNTLYNETTWFYKFRYLIDPLSKTKEKVHTLSFVEQYFNDSYNSYSKKHLKNSTPLTIAFDTGEISTVQFLLEKGANIDFIVKRHSPFSRIIKRTDRVPDRYIIEFIKEYNIDINNLTGSSVLSLACEYERFKLVDFLLHEISNIGNHKQTIAKLAGKNRLDIVEYLLKKDILLYFEKLDYSFLLAHIIFENDTDILELLMKYGFTFNSDWKNIVETIIKTDFNVTLEMLELLIKLGFDINSTYQNKNCIEHFFENVNSLKKTKIQNEFILSLLNKDISVINLSNNNEFKIFLLEHF